MSDAVRPSLTLQLARVFILGFVALCVYSLQKQIEIMKDRTVIDDVELFLKAARLQSLVVGEQQHVVDEITRNWKNDNYIGPMKAVKVKDWIKQHGGTLSP